MYYLLITYVQLLYMGIFGIYIYIYKIYTHTHTYISYSKAMHD